MLRTVVNVVILVLVGLFVCWYLSTSNSEYEKKTNILKKQVDSLNTQIDSTKTKISRYKDSLTVLDSLYRSKKKRRDSIRTVYVEKKIPAIDSFTVDSLIQYFRSRYNKKGNSAP